jgi:Undecaprenyl-phosphate glucose phosphotransferase
VRLLTAALLVVGDAIAIGLAFAAAHRLHAMLEQRPGRVAPLEEYVPSLGFLIISLLVTFALMRLYLPRRGASHSDQLGSILMAVTVGNVVAMALAAFTLYGLDVPRQLLVYAWGLSIIFVWAARILIEQALRGLRSAGLDRERVLVIGAGDESQTILHKIARAPELGCEVVGIITDGDQSGAWGSGIGDRADGSQPPTPRPPPPTPSLGFTPYQPKVLGSLPDLPTILLHSDVGEVVVADPSLSHAQILDIVSACDRFRVSVRVFPDVFQLMVREVGASEFGGLPMLRVRDVSLRGWNLVVKRAMDVVLAAVLIVLLAPLMILVAIAVKLTSPRGPVFFIQERVGVDGRPFPCVKFRSMRADAEAETGPVWTAADDARTTPLGRLLRRLSIDEVPQLVNVLVGDMSLVGPRPERPYFVEQFRRLIPRYEKRHQEKAGVTGWAQVNGLRGQTSIKERTLYDLFYVEHWSPPFDLNILIRTIAAVIRRRNAY